MSTNTLEFTNKQALLSSCSAYDLIDSAIALLDKKIEIIYQNNSFKNLCTPSSPQIAENFKGKHIILDNQEVIDAIFNCIAQGETLDINTELPFNSKISLPLKLKTTPLFCKEENTTYALISFVDESLCAEMKNKLAINEKQKKLATQIEKLSQENIDNRNLIYSLLTKAPFGMAIFDDEQRLLQINNSGSAMLDTAPHLATSRHCSDFFYCHQQLESCPVIHENQDIEQQEFTTSDKLGSNNIFLKSCTRIKIGNKNAVLESFIDVTEKIQYQSDLMDAVIESERANKLKSEFLANMSHELRTPLHAILGFSKLGEQKTDPQQEKIISYFNKISVSGNTLLTLLNDLLDISKLEAGQMHLNLKITTINSHVSHVVDELHSLAAEKNITIEVTQEEDPAPLEMDSEKIKQVIRNLLGNSLKFSPENGAIIIQTKNVDNTVEFSIQDSGPGIPPNEQEEVFEKFIQSSATKTGAGGTGLGLSICRQLIQLHKGTIRSEKVDKGALFKFVLPCHEASTN